jgi:uncharacterized protein (DUF1501 family)
MMTMSFDTFALHRRTFLAGAGASLLAATASRAVLADAPTDRRFVLIILRGAMDGMNVVVPYGDRDYAGLRGPIALAKPGESDGLTDLDGFYGLHPALADIAPWYKEGALLPIQAVASPYRDRSHFDGQDVLENGTLSAHGTDIGWLNRALSAMGGGASGSRSARPFRWCCAARSRWRPGPRSSCRSRTQTFCRSCGLCTRTISFFRRRWPTASARPRRPTRCWARTRTR